MKMKTHSGQDVSLRLGAVSPHPKIHEPPIFFIYKKSYIRSTVSCSNHPIIWFVSHIIIVSMVKRLILSMKKRPASSSYKVRKQDPRALTGKACHAETIKWEEEKRIVTLANLPS